MTLSDSRPVGILDLSYDAPNGFYGALSGSIVATRHEGVRPLRLALNGGYAKQLRRNLTADLGIVHSRYSEYSGLSSGRSYTELYAGLFTTAVGTRFSISPNYLGAVRWTLRGEISGHADLGSKLTVEGVVGATLPLRGAGYPGAARAPWDARIGASHNVGRVSLHAAVTARGDGADAYGSRSHRRVALIVGLSSAL